MAATDVEDELSGARSNGYGEEGYDFEDSDDEIAARNEQNLKAEETKNLKPKKEKNPKVSLPEAAAKIDPSNLTAFLLVASESYATRPEIQLMRFADYFGRALFLVSSVQFPWVKIFKESSLSKLIDIAAGVSEDIIPGLNDPTNFALPQQPLNICLFPESAPYNTFSSCPNPHSFDVDNIIFLGTSDQNIDDLDKYAEAESKFDFVERTLKWKHLAPTAPNTLDLATQQGGSKGGEKGARHTSSKSQVAIFVHQMIVLSLLLVSLY